MTVSQQAQWQGPQKKRKEKKAMRTAAMPVSFIGHAFFYLSEVLWISGAGNVKRYFELFLL